MTDKSDDMVPTAEQVLQFLTENPDFLDQVAIKDLKKNDATEGLRLVTLNICFM